jgi:cell division protein FtsB
MVSRTRFKSFLTGLGLYVLAGLLIGYFWINAFTGKYGLNAQQELDQEMVALKDELGRLKGERTEWERRVALLRSDKLDPDMLDERARAQLEFVSPRDLVMTIKR